MVHRRVLTKAGEYLVKYSMSKLMKKSKAQINNIRNEKRAKLHM